MSRAAFVAVSTAQLTPVAEEQVDFPPVEDCERAPLSVEQSALLFEFRCLLDGLEQRLLRRVEGLEEGRRSQSKDIGAIHKNRRGIPWSENVHVGAHLGQSSTVHRVSSDNSNKHGTRKRSQSSIDFNGSEVDESSTEARCRSHLSNVSSFKRILSETRQRFAHRPRRHSYSTEDMHKREAAREGASTSSPEAHSCQQHSESQRTLGAIVSSHTFEAVFAVLIAVNALFIGVEVEISARYPSEQRHLAFFVADTVFAGIFLVELLLRVYVLRCGFFKRENRFWGCLDTLLVVSSLIEAFVEALVLLGAGTGKGIDDVSQLRLFRILRITRAVRTLRVTRLIRFVASLRTLITSILATLQSLMWALLLLFILIYGVAIAFTEAATDYLFQNGEDPAMEAFWGSLPQAMFTLYESISGGVSWHDAVEPLYNISVGFVALFSVYIFFTTFAVLNVLTGVFCQSAIDTVSRDPDLAAQAVIAQRQSYLINLRRVFDMMDKEGTGQITLLQLEDLLSDARMQAYLAAMGVEASDAWSVFKLIDVNASHAIDKDEFVAGMLRMRGQATSMDVQTLMERQNWISSRLDSLRRDEEETR